MFDFLDYATKKRMLCYLIPKLNSYILKTILDYLEMEGVKISKTNKYFLFDLHNLQDNQIYVIWNIIFSEN